MLFPYFVNSAFCIATTKGIALAKVSTGNSILQNMWKVKNVCDLYSFSAKVFIVNESHLRAWKT